MLQNSNSSWRTSSKNQRRLTYARKLRMEPLEDRSLLSVSSLSTLLTSTASSSTVTTSSSAVSTTVTVAATVNSTAATSSTYGDTVTLTVTVAASSGSTTPSGTVVLYIGTSSSSLSSFATATLSDGSASFSTSSLSAGTHYYKVVYTPTDSTAFSSSTSSTTSFTVNKAALTLTATDQSITYGDSLPTFTYTYSGLVNSETISTALSTTPSLTTTATSSSDAGTYTIYIFNAASSNYTITYKTGTLTINKATLTIKADSQTMVYGDTDGLPTLTVTYSGLVNDDTVSEVVTGAPTISTTATATSNAGTYTITVSGATVSSTNYTVSYSTGTLTITKATLQISAVNASMVYGSTSLPTLTYTYSGFVNGDDESDLTTAPTITTTATAYTSSTKCSNVGTYTITVSGAAATNYNITYAVAYLTVTQASLTGTYTGAWVYGQSPAYYVTYSGLVNGDSVTSSSASMTTAPTGTPTANSKAGTYSFLSGTVMSSSVTGFTTSNYSIGYVWADIVISKATLTIAASTIVTTYTGSTISYSGYYTTTGLIGNSVTSISYDYATVFVSVSSTPQNVGVYTLSISSALIYSYDTAHGSTASSTGYDASGNYNVVYVSGTLTIKAATLTITPTAKSITYGTALDQTAYTVSGLLGSDTASSTITSIVLAATNYSSSNGYSVGTGIIYVESSTVSSNYVITSGYATLTVTAATLTVTASDQTLAYGSSLSSTAYTYSGLASWDDFDDLDLGITLTTDSEPGVGTHTITASGASSTSNYTITYVSGTLTVTQAAIIITADDLARTYGDDNPTLTYTASGLQYEDTLDSIGVTVTISTSATSSSDAGTYIIYITGADSTTNYTITYVNGALTVEQAVLYVIADDQTKVYGDNLPTLTYSVTDEDGNVLTGMLATNPTLSTTATSSSNVGEYEITATGAVASDATNYTVEYVSGTLTVTQATLTITVSDETKVYGDDNPDLTGDYTVSGFVNGDASLAAVGITGVTVSASSVTATTGAGTYSDAVIATYTGSSDNYEIVIEYGDFTVTKRTLTIAADDATKIYGNANPALTYTVSNLVNGDTLSSIGVTVTLAASSVTTSTSVGTYDDAVTVATSGTPSNYTIVTEAGDFTVTKRTLTVTASDTTKTYGDANPALTYTVSNLVNGDTLSSIGVTVTVSASSITTTTDVGTYTDIIVATCSGDAENYEIVTEAGDFTVTKRTLTITADDQTKVYGDDNPTLTYTTDGLVNGDTVSSIGLTVTLSTTATSSDAPGTYTITVTGSGSLTNYSVTYVSGTLTITKDSLTFTGKSVTKTYGSYWLVSYLTNAGKGYSVQTDSETLSSIPTGLTVSIVSVTDSDGNTVSDPVSADAGTYTVTYSVSGTSTYYTYSTTTFTGTLVIAKASLTVTATSTSKAYGDALSSFTYTLSGLVNGDTASELTSSGWSPTLSTTASQYSSVGSYTITFASTPSLDNYEITYVSGTLTVTKRTLTITADNQTMFTTPGATLPTLTYTVSGLVNGDTLATTPTLSTSSSATTTAGTYTITVSGASADNYSITYVSGTLTSYAGTACAALVADSVTGVKSLYIFGTTASDTISVVPVSSSNVNTVIVYLNNKKLGTYTIPSGGRIVVHGFAGKDTITINKAITRSAWLYGDAGNDKLVGGSGATYLFGGAGADTLVSGAGRTIMIGGAGADSLVANNSTSTGQAVLIGGTTSYDANDSALYAILKEWNSSHTYANRIKYLDGDSSDGLNGSFFLNANTVQNDSAVDQLLASGSVLDWIFQSSNDTLKSSSTTALKWVKNKDTILSV